MRNHYVPFSQGANVSGMTKFQVYMVLALASLERTRFSKGRQFAHHDFFAQAVRHLDSATGADDLECLQCLLLLCMYGRTEPQSVNMWYTIGLALRIAVGLDLHRADSIKRLDLFQAELSKRVFWCIYAMDRSMSMYLGRPLGIPDTEITLPFPQQLTDEQLEDTTSVVVPNDRPDVKDMSTFIHVIKLRRINAEIYGVFHSVTAKYLVGTELETERQSIHGQLNEWLITAPRYATSSSMFQSPEWFQIAYHHAILSLHRPSYARPEPSVEALQLCADSSISLISCYGSLYAKNKVSYSFVALHSIFMAAVTMLYSLRASPQVRQDLTKEVIETNINSCLNLLKGISNGRGIADKASRIISSLGKAVLSLVEYEFDRHQTISGTGKNQEVDTEFLSWFGLKSRAMTRPLAATFDPSNQQADWQIDGLNDPGVLNAFTDDNAWEELFNVGFGMDGTASMDFFPHTGF